MWVGQAALSSGCPTWGEDWEGEGAFFLCLLFIWDLKTFALHL